MKDQKVSSLEHSQIHNSDYTFILPWNRASDKPESIIVFGNVTKTYTLNFGAVTGIDSLSLEVKAGEFVAIMGPSGSGKSTLLHLMGCLDIPNEGTITICGHNINQMSDYDLTNLRLSTIGFIFQSFNLFPLLTALGNVQFPYIVKTGDVHNTMKAEQALIAAGLPEKSWQHRPNQLSGGQQQRVAIARALVNDPAILLCDEPTGNLDRKTGTMIMKLLSDLSKSQRKTVIMVTHDPSVAAYAGRIIRIEDGRISG